MNNLMNLNGGKPITMTSLELVDFINEDRRARAEAAGAEFPSKGFAKLEHSDFMKKVPEVLQGVSEKFLTPYIHPQNGQTYDCYRFPKREACLMAMSYSYELQAKVFDRMTDLEAKQAQPAIPKNYADALRLAAETVERNEQLALENKAQAQALAVAQPKAEALDLIAAGEKSVTIREAAKLLGVKENRLTSWLHEHDWTYRLNGRWVAKQPHIQAGRLIYKEARYTDEKTGHEVYAPYCHITPKGLAKLAQEFSKEQMAVAA